MDKRMFDFLEDERDTLVEKVFAQARQSSSAHYRQADFDLLRSRCIKLVHNFLESLFDTPTRLAEYLGRIADDRIAEGYTLQEIQLILSIFEQEAWELCGRMVEDRDKLLSILSMVSWTIGNGKDELARAYLERAGRAEAELAELRAMYDSLTERIGSGGAAYVVD